MSRFYLFLAASLAMASVANGSYVTLNLIAGGVCLVLACLPTMGDNDDDAVIIGEPLEGE